MNGKILCSKRTPIDVTVPRMKMFYARHRHRSRLALAFRGLPDTRTYPSGSCAMFIPPNFLFWASYRYLEHYQANAASECSPSIIGPFIRIAVSSI